MSVLLVGTITITSQAPLLTYAAVAAKISVLELVPWVRNMRPAAKSVENPVIQINKSRVPCSCVSAAIATTGIKQAIIVEKPDVSRKAVSSDTDSSVLRSYCGLLLSAAGKLFCASVSACTPVTGHISMGADDESFVEL